MLLFEVDAWASDGNFLREQRHFALIGINKEGKKPSFYGDVHKERLSPKLYNRRKEIY